MDLNAVSQSELEAVDGGGIKEAFQYGAQGFAFGSLVGSGFGGLGGAIGGALGAIGGFLAGLFD
jgi:hypothetical protein